ncbi:hypothetical protein GF359_04010, partial [candidate division WOR-3 bacterium]|nr:hypothetical protein [candidate division WOR-3 bacterium]MBD3364362.1 hypothetical protein [candidate division WOR-3 bacterium]
MKKHIILLLALAGALAAQNWSVQLLPPPPQNVFIHELWKCRITNNEKEPVEVTLTGWATESGKEIARGTSNPITIPPGGKMVTSADITGGKWDYDSKYEPYALEGRPLPRGEYKYCIRVDRASDGQMLAQDCEDFEVGGKITPPKLISPRKFDEIKEGRPNFSWTPLIPPQKDATYEIKIVEVKEGMSAEEAIDERPLVEEKDLSTTTLMYPAYGDTLEPGNEYAWQVKAVVDDEIVGESEVWTFAYSPTRDYEEQQIFKANWPHIAVQEYSSSKPITRFEVSEPDDSGYVYLRAYSNASSGGILKNWYPHTAFQEFRFPEGEYLVGFEVQGPDDEGNVYLLAVGSNGTKG